MEYAVDVFEVSAGTDVRKIKTASLVSQSPDLAKREAKALAKKLGYAEVRAIAFSTPGSIKLYVTREVEHKAKIQAGSRLNRSKSR